MKVVLSASCFAIGALTASAALTPFPYNATLNTRYSSGPVEVSSFENPVTVSGDGMQAGESIFVFESDVLDFCASDTENWTKGTTAVGTPQAAFSMKYENSACKWMGYVANADWVEFTGVTAAEGEWNIKIEIDYSVPSAKLVRYSVKAKGASDYTALAYGGITWLPLAGSSSLVSSVKLYGCGEINSATGKCGVRPIEATVETANAIGMNYDSLEVGVNVTENWGVDTVSVILKNAQGGQVATKQVELTDGKGGVEFAGLTAGANYSYEVSVGGSGQTKTVGKSEAVDLFANVDWFGFKDGAFVKATGSNIAIADKAFKATSGTGTVNPETAASEEAETVFEGRLVVNGAYQLGHQFDGETGAKAIPSVTGQFAITLARKAGASETQLGDRTWVVWKNGAWTSVSFATTENGNYDAKVTVNYKTGTGTYYLKTETQTDYTQVATFTVTAKKLANAAVIGGSISALNASFKTTKPVEVLPDETKKEIPVARNAEVDLAKMTPNETYTVTGDTGISRLKWKDAKDQSGKTTTYAKVTGDGKLQTFSGAPANGVESYASYVLGLNPETATDKPAAVVSALTSGDPENPGVKVEVPAVQEGKVKSMAECGYKPMLQLQKKSGDVWANSGEPVEIGTEVVVPLDGNEYRVNTVLK
ncbi:MAG: hypothetical protein KBT68_01310 [bacterium]|nr:hypothetical protein [Candidatus Colisoma equi]